MLTINHLESELEKYRLELENKSREYDLSISSNSKLTYNIDTLNRENLECRDELILARTENKGLINNLKKVEDSLKEIESKFHRLDGSHSGCGGYYRTYFLIHICSCFLFV